MSTDPQLFDPDRPDQLPDPGRKKIGGFRKGARATSRKAAISIYPRSGTIRRRVLDAFVEAGARGLTHEELTAIISPHNLALSTPRSRASELERDGYLESSGFERMTQANEESTVWILSEQGKQWVLANSVSAGEQA